MDSDVKHVLTTAELKVDGADAGRVRAVFSTFGVVDKDREIVLASAIPSGITVSMCDSHDWFKEVGEGVVTTTENEGIFDGGFWLETFDGEQTYLKAKRKGPRQQWSWGFRVLAAHFEERADELIRVIEKAEIYEVSPVLRAAGEGTRTLDIKSFGDKYTDQAEAALATVEALTARSKALATLRAKEGRVLSAANREKLAGLVGRLDEAIATVKELLDATNPEKADAGRRAYLDFLRTDMEIAAVAAGVR